MLVRLGYGYWYATYIVYDGAFWGLGLVLLGWLALKLQLVPKRIKRVLGWVPG